MSWTFTESVNTDSIGVFRVAVWRTRAEVPLDVTYLYGAPVQVQELSYGDPFGDATAVFQFPSVTGFLSLDWLREFTNVDVYWVPANTTPSAYPCLDPRTGQWGMYLHPESETVVWEGFFESIDVARDGVTVRCKGALYQLDRYFAKPMFPLRPKLVENMLERYFDPRRRGLWTQPLEIEWEPNWKTYELADYNRYKDLGYGSNRYIPTGITIDEDGNIKDGSREKYAAEFGKPWTGFTTRMTGSWERVLTGYINNQLGILFTENTDGDALQKGDQWTITKVAPRKPVMRVRRQSKDVDYVVWFGQPGVDARLTREGGMFNNVVFGTGKSYQESEWSNFVQPVGTWTTWEPLAYKHNHDPENHPETDWASDTTRVWFGDVWETSKDKTKPAGYYNSVPTLQDLWDGYDAERERRLDIPVYERYSTFPDGISEGDGQSISRNWIERESDPGWAGDIILSVDPVDLVNTPKNKWMIRAGDVIALYGFQGTGATVEQGVNKFHISSVTLNPMDGTVSLKVDTKFRDLLSMEEALAKGRDSLTPIKALQVGKKSVMINDLAMPWSNNKGSGCFPLGAKSLKRTDGFPYESVTRQYPPKMFFKDAYLPGGGSIGLRIENMRGANGTLAAAVKDEYKDLQNVLYAPIRANTDRMDDRWVILPVLIGQAADIAVSEFAIYDKDGNLFPCEFHVSVWQTKPNVEDMPQKPDEPNRGEYGALWSGPDGDAFDLIRNDGTTWREGDDGSWYTGSSPANMIVGWGNHTNPCGYHPRKKTDTNAQKTGVFRDASPWSIDFAQWVDFHANNETKNSTLTSLDYSAWVAVHVEQTNQRWLYVMGRFYRKVVI